MKVMKMFSRKYLVQIRIYYYGSPRYTFISTENDIVDHGIAKCVFCVSNTNYEKRMQSSEKLVTEEISHENLPHVFSPPKMCTFNVNSSKI